MSNQFPEPTFTPPDDLSDLTYELSGDQYLYFVGEPRDVSPVWHRYMLIDGSFVDITPDVQK